MSIVVGFNCSDGVLLASDTLYSGTVHHSYGPKLWIVHKSDPVVVFGAAGTVGPITRARREIKRVIRNGMLVTEVLHAIDGVLHMIDEKFPKPDQKQVQALVAIRTDKENALFQNIYGETALSPVDGGYVCLGIDVLGNYFAEALFRRDMSLKWAKRVAAYLVGTCKKYAAGYVGGDTHLVEVPTAGVPRVITEQVETLELESYLAGIDDALRMVLPDGRADDNTLEIRLLELKTVIHQLKRKLYIELKGNIQLSSVLYPPSLEALPDKPKKEGE